MRLVYMFSGCCGSAIIKTKVERQRYADVLTI